MRAAIARARKQVRVERAAAEAARKLAAPVVPPSRTRWSRRTGPAKPPSGAEAEVARRVKKASDAWGCNHPHLQRAEYDLADARAEIEERWDHKRHGTPPTLEHAARTDAAPLARLFRTGGIDRDQLAASVEIATVFERIGREVAVRTASLETRIDAGQRGDGAFFEALGQVRSEVAYRRWRAKLGPSGAVVLAMIVGDGDNGPAGNTVIARRYGMRKERARALLIDALDLWQTEVRRACDWIDERDVRVAQIRAGARVA